MSWTPFLPYNPCTSFRQTAGQFEQRLKTQLNSTDRIPDGYQEAPLAYDAIWAIALGTNSAPPVSQWHPLLAPTLFCFVQTDMISSSDISSFRFYAK